jgi:hypothetical protein
MLLRAWSMGSPATADSEASEGLPDHPGGGYCAGWAGKELLEPAGVPYRRSAMVSRAAAKPTHALERPERVGDRAPMRGLLGDHCEHDCLSGIPLNAPQRGPLAHTAAFA